MYPMISCLDELIQANALLDECRAELRAENIPFNEALEVGAMIEIPSAAIIAGALAKRVNFFSIGTNDLIQYSLAVDRLNEKIAHLYEPAHPAILQLIKMTVDAARVQGIPVTVCGEMAGDPIYVPLLLGLGVDELSASPPSIPQLKFLIRRLRLDEARDLAEFALACESGSEILVRAKAWLTGSPLGYSKIRSRSPVLDRRARPSVAGLAWPDADESSRALEAARSSLAPSGARGTRQTDGQRDQVEPAARVLTSNRRPTTQSNFGIAMNCSMASRPTAIKAEA